ncbi:MAG: DUF4389 domain-containing protein [Nocardiopsaceae bacterium]|nr:DUF4389 domain-containing protein [Nocardiopsaceae bacterium]
MAAILVALALTSISLGVVSFLALNRQIADFQRVPAPGRAEVSFTQPGEYVLYVERPAPYGGESFSIGDRTFARWSVSVLVVPANGGPQVHVRNWHSLAVSYQVAGHQGQTLASVAIPSPGNYVLTIRNVNPRTITDLAVGRQVTVASMFLPPLLAVAGLAALIGAIVLAAITASSRRRARMGTGDYAGRGSGLGIPATIEVRFAGPGRQRRTTVALRIILALPQLLCLALVRYVAQIVLIAGWICALYSGRLPNSIAEFLAGYQQWEVRLTAYLLLLTDAYPPFGLRDADYPVSVVVRPGALNRIVVLFRAILVLPARIVWDVLVSGLAMVMILGSWLIVLILGRMPQPLHDALAAIVRYGARLKGYWYMLTDVYPGGLFGDQPALVIGGEIPATEQLPPAGHVGPLTASGEPGPAARPLVLSRPAKRLVSLTLATGLIAPFALFYVLFALATIPARAPSATPPAATPSASAAASRSIAPTPLTRTEVWVAGLRGLRKDMDAAMGSGAPTTVTAPWLRSEARKFGRCTAELDALGPPPHELRAAYRKAGGACGHFERGAACYSAAARAFNYAPATSKRGARFDRLLNCGDAAVNSGALAIAMAASDASFAGTRD